MLRLPPLPSQETGFEASLLFSICQYLDLPGPSQSRCRELDHILVLQMPVRRFDLIPVSIKSFHWILRKPLPVPGSRDHPSSHSQGLTGGLCWGKDFGSVTQMLGKDLFGD